MTENLITSRSYAEDLHVA